MNIKVFLLAILLSFSGISIAQTYTVISNGTGGGNWDDDSSWLGNAAPVCADIIHIVSGDVINISGQENYSESFCPGDYMYLMVEGTLEFSSNGPKLRFPCSGSAIEVGVGGSVIRTGGGGGQNNYIDICSDVVWTGTDPDITEPVILTGPLPIELLSFDLKEVDGMCDVSWATATEINNDFFTIERSRDLSFWEVIATIDGSGNSSQVIEYGHRDPHPWPGVSYYRLRQTDFNGQFVTFDIEALVMGGSTAEISMYPNPANDQVVISGSNIKEVEVRDALGRRQVIPTPFTNTENVRFDVSDLPEGIYQMEFFNEKGSQGSETLYILR